MMKPSDWRVIRSRGEDVVFSMKSCVLSPQGRVAEVRANDDYVCREELSYSVRYEIQGIARGEKKGISVFDDRLRQPGSTYLLGGTDLCPKPCCGQVLTHTLDALVALPSTLLNPDRYLGDRWVCSREDLFRNREYLYHPDGCGSTTTIKYCGVDNTILHHPALLGIVIGFFRQALAMHSAGKTQGLEEAVPHAALIKAISEDDTGKCLELFSAARPWVEAQTTSDFFPVTKGSWGNFLDLHRALYNQGFTRVFGTLESGWELSDAYRKYNGPVSYFDAARWKEIKKLAKKAA